jgi:hypothetical protein
MPSLMQRLMRRPRQVTEVYEVTGAEAVNAKLQSLIDAGTMITSVTPVTVEGKSMIIIIGMPTQPARPPMTAAGQPPHLPAPGPAAPSGQTAVQAAPSVPAKP